MRKAVLFSDSYTGEKTQVQYSVFSGLTKGSERIVTINRFKGNLIDAYPERALFEGIIKCRGSP